MSQKDVEGEINAAELAACFAKLLYLKIGFEKFMEMRSLNTNEDVEGICHSHDFCDANVVMLEAFEKATGDRFGMGDENSCELWNDAWKFAHQHLLSN